METRVRAAGRDGLRRHVASGVALFLIVALIAVSLPLRVDAAPSTIVLRPVADAWAEWSKSSHGGKNFDRVDEATSDGDATYVYTSTAVATDGYEMQDIDIPASIGYVAMHAVGRVASGACSGAPSNDCIAVGVNSGITTWYNNSLPFGSTYGEVSFAWTNNPFTNQPWTVAEVNAVRAVILKEDATSTVRVTQVWFEVQITPTTGIVNLRPNANWTLIEWRKSGGGGKNFDRVDEATSDGDATYVYTSSLGARDVYEMQDLPFQGTIGYVKVHTVGRVARGNCDPLAGCIQLGVTFGSTFWYGGGLTLSSSYTDVTATWTVEPGGSPWTVTDVNALKVVLLKSTAVDTATVRVTQVWIEVQITPT